MKYKMQPFVFVLFCCLCPLLLSAQTKSETDSTQKVTFAAIPVINYNTSMGFIAGGIGAAYYKLNANDTISPSSSSMLFGVLTGNNSWMGLAAQKFYFNQDKWRATLVGGTGNFFFQFYQGFPGALNGRFLDGGIWIDFDTQATFGMAELQHQVIKNLYLGVEVLLMRAETTYDLPIGEIKPSTSASMNSLGYTLQYDSRDDVNFPTKGYFANFKNRFVRDWMGSTEDFDRYELSANYFWDLKNNGKSVLVSRVYADIAAGDVPFEGENFIGGDDLRGYSKGEFRGNQIYAVQAELRQNVYKKFGMIGFIGVGSAVDEINEIPDRSLLPSIGFGIRYLMIAEEKVNIGIDVGKGKNDWSLTFRIGEAFSR